MSFVLRKALNSELKTVKLYADEFHLDSYKLEKQKLYIAEKNGQIAGFGRYKQYKDIYEISTIGVLKDFRGYGVGKMIISKLIEVTGTNNIWLTTVIPEYFQLMGFEKSAFSYFELNIEMCKI